MNQVRAANEHPLPEFDLAIDVAVPERRWYDVEDDPEAAVKSAVRATIGQARAKASLDIRAGAEISIVLGNDALVQGLNRDFRNQDRPTNVLSFPLAEGEAAADADFSGGPMMLGDVVLALDTVTREAVEQAKSPRDHALHLVVHGVLHLMDYDHGTEAEARVMERMEQQVLADLGIADPYLERPPLA